MYAYVTNNPTTLADPSGLDPTPPSFANLFNSCDPDTQCEIEEAYLGAANANGTTDSSQVGQEALRVQNEEQEQRQPSQPSG